MHGKYFLVSAEGNMVGSGEHKLERRDETTNQKILENEQHLRHYPGNKDYRLTKERHLGGRY